MKTMLKRNWLTLLVLAAPFVFLAAVWPRIPDRFPIHFNASFKPDGWMPRPWGPLLLPLTSVVVHVFVMVWFHFDRKMARADAGTREHVGRVLRRCMTAVALLLGVMSVTMVWASWGSLRPMVLATCYGVPLLFVVLGNAFGKLRPNYTIGIRVPWTLESPVVWMKTHRLGGRLMVALGLGLVAAYALGVEGLPYFLTLIGGLLLWAAAVMVYAFMMSRRATRMPA